MPLDQRAILATLAARVVAAACQACDHADEIPQAIVDLATCSQSVPLSESEIVALLAHPCNSGVWGHREEALVTISLAAWHNVQ